MKSMRFRQPAAPRLAWLTRVARTLAVLVGTLVAGAQPAAFARSGAVATVEEVADLAPLMPRPAGAGDEPLASIAPRLPLLPVQVFKTPSDTQSFEAAPTVDVAGGIGGKATITIVLRRASAGR
jgi:hypothetical protein